MPCPASGNLSVRSSLVAVRPSKREIVTSGGRPPSLTKAEQERAIMLIRQDMSLEKIAELFNTSHDTTRRLAKSRGIELQRSERKLLPEQLSEAYDLFMVDVPFREVAQRYAIHPESLRRLALRDGVELRTRGEKLTPEQLEEVHTLIDEGVSVRKVAKRVGISRGGFSWITEGRRRLVVIKIRGVGYSCRRPLFVSSGGIDGQRVLSHQRSHSSLSLMEGCISSYNRCLRSCSWTQIRHFHQQQENV